MIDSIIFLGNNGQAVTLNDDTYPLTTFDSQVETSTEERNRPSQHGLYNTFTYMRRRTIHMEGDIFAADSADFLTKRNQLMAPFIPVPELGSRSVGYLEVKYTGLNEAVSCECYLDGLPAAPLEALSPSRGTFAISLIAFDPVMYGTDLVIATTGIPTGGGGISFPITFPVTFGGGSGGSGDVQLVNAGNASVHPTVVIKGPCTDPSLTLHVGSEDYVWQLDGLNLDANQTLTADFQNRTITTDTQGSAYGLLVPGSTWWAVPPGAWRMSFRAFSASAGCAATVKFANAYIL